MSLTDQDNLSRKRNRVAQKKKKKKKIVKRTNHRYERSRPIFTLHQLHLVLPKFDPLVV